MELVIISVMIWVSIILGYKIGKGDDLGIKLPKILKRVVRTEAQEAELVDKLQRAGKK